MSRRAPTCWITVDQNSEMINICYSFNFSTIFTLFLPRESPCTTQKSLLMPCHQFLKLQKYKFQHEHEVIGLISLVVSNPEKYKMFHSLGLDLHLLLKKNKINDTDHHFLQINKCSYYLQHFYLVLNKHY